MSNARESNGQNELSAVKKRLLQERLRVRPRTTSDQQAARQTAAPEYVPLSSYQKQIWLADRFQDSHTAYARPLLLSIQGQLDHERLQDAINQLAARHEILRTSFPLVNTVPMQKINPAYERALERMDISSYTRTQQETFLETLLDEHTRSYPIDLEPPFYPLLIRKAQEEYLLFLNMHHIINDAWSTQVIIDDLFSVYQGNSLITDKTQALPQYRDFTEWQLEKDKEITTEIEFWKKILPAEKSKFVFDIPQDASGERDEAGIESFSIGTEEVSRIRELCANQKTTVFAFFMACYSVLLHRYTMENEIILGAEISRRVLPEFERLVGVFINLVPFKTNLSGNPKFLELLQFVHKHLVEIIAGKDVPFERLVQELVPARSGKQTPWIQAFIDFRNYPRARTSIQDLSIREIKLPRRKALFDLTLDITETRDGMSCSLVFKMGVFSSQTIRRMAEHYLGLIRSILNKPNSKIGSLMMLNEAEQVQVLRFQEGPANPVEPLCIQELFERTARRYPQRTAIQHNDQRITYGALNDRASSLAGALHNLEIQPGDRIAVCLDRSINLIISMLAIWKVGGAYVPLDPSTPLPYHRRIWEDVGASILLTSRSRLQEFEGEQIKVLDVESLKFDVCKSSSPIFAPGDLSPDRLAYILHTSGSTGSPKGVAVEHRSLVNVLQWYIREFNISPEDRISQSTRITFDPSMRETWGCLTAGACLHICDEAVLLDPQLYWRWVSRERISIAYLPTPLGELMLRSTMPDDLVLRYLHISGDKLNALPEKDLTFRLVNLYGPTETTTNCSAAVYPAKYRGVPHIGKPIDNTSIYILDSYLNPVPPGFFGEIYISGQGVSRGYWQRSELTQERFLPGPFHPGRKMYKSGDWGRFLEDGNIEFSGRKDLQVKINGQRIELSEIEAEMDRLPGIEKALARVVETKAGDKLIVGYVLSKAPIDEQELLTSLQKRLPKRMQPSTIMQIEQIPYSANGKYNRSALPEPNMQPSVDQSTVQPQNPTQKELFDIWAQLLPSQSFGIDANFFDLGGHSLLATKLCILVEEQLERKISYADVFENPTVRQMAALLDQGPGEKMGNRSDAPIEIHLAPLSPSQQGMWFMQQVQPESTAYHINICLKLKGLLDRQALQFALDEIVRRHETLRTTYPLQKNEVVQQVHPPTPVRVDEYDISAAPPAEWDAHVEEIYLKRQTAFDLQQEIPLRFLLIRCAPDFHQLVLIVHHILFDGSSIDLFIEEIAHHYQRAVSNDIPALPEVPEQYGEYSARYHQWLNSQEALKQLGYWQSVFETEPPTLEITSDYRRRKIRQPKGTSFILNLPKALTADLRRVCGQENVTPFMLLLAVYNVLLHRHTGLEDISIGAPINLRQERDQQNLIGLYINTLAIRSTVIGRQSFRSFLQELRSICLHAYENRDIPFEKLVEETGFNRSGNSSPLFQVMFQLNRTRAGRRSAGDLQIDLSSLPYPSAKFDLILNIREHNDGMVCAFNYNADLFREERIKNMAAHYKKLLECIVLDPDQSISELPLIDEVEHERILKGWTGTAAAVPAQTVQSRFSQIARQNPHASALVGDQPMTYQELEKRSSKLANFLRKHGVQTGELVAVCAHSTTEMVVSLLGILKAGAAYVPIDPEYPQERIDRMLADSDPQVILTHSRWRSKIKGGKYRLFCLDEAWQTISSESCEPPPSSAQSDSPAYVIYTSGSTGQPKGVVVPHRAILRLVLETDYITILPSDTLAQVSNLSFDAATFEIWGALLNGARLALISKEALLTPALLEKKLAETSVNIMFLTTALFNTYASRYPLILSKLRCLLFGGEESDPQIVHSFLEDGFAGDLLHVYGPTENTTFSTWHRVDNVPENALSVPIGKPIANTQAYILDQSLKLLPAGIPGELYLGGAGLALGYLNQPEFTAERFIPNPFQSSAKEKLYKTGDFCEYRNDGCIVFLRRKDDQIKIRGFRVELGEINSALRKHPAVNNAAVILIKNNLGEKMLAGYITPAEEPVDLDLIRNHLHETLPSYMVPSALIWIDTIPLSPNGKVDRARLPQPDEAFSPAQPTHPPSLKPLQLRLLEIWKRVLEKEEIGVHDNFFDLGGHSILIVKLCVEIEDKLGASLSFSQVFEAPTISQLSLLIEGDPTVKITQVHPETLVDSTKKAFFWIGGGFWQFQKNLNHIHPIRIPEQGEDGLPARFTSVEALAAKHVETITAIRPEGPYCLGGFSFGGMVAFETARQMKEKGLPVDLLFLIEPTMPLRTGGSNKSGGAYPQKIDALSILLSRLSRHADNLSKIQPQYRTKYFWHWLKTQYQNRIVVKMIGRLSTLIHRLGKMIPLKWRHYYIKNLNDKLSSQYRPAAFPGRMILVKRKGPNNPAYLLNRQDLPAAQTEIIEIPDCISHEDLMHEPFVQIWMERLDRLTRFS